LNVELRRSRYIQTFARARISATRIIVEFSGMAARGRPSEIGGNRGDRRGGLHLPHAPNGSRRPAVR
jgi:hypothetical protein